MRGSGGMIYMPSFIRIGSDIQKLTAADSQIQSRKIAKAYRK
jgi:hypothetical protein